MGRAAPGRGIRFISGFGPSGYALAAIAHLRGLVNAGFDVEWRIVADGWGGSRATLATPPREAAFAAGDAALADLAALVDATSLPIACDTVVAFTVPELWPSLFEPGCAAIGCTVWETDRLPPHWRPLLARAHRVVVPCEHNREVFATAMPRERIAVVPHVRRHVFNDFAPAELAALRRELALDAVDTVFYTIGAWHPRKDLATLVRAFTRAFSADDRVALLIKTEPLGVGAPPFYRREPVEPMARALIEAAAGEISHAPPRVVVLPYEMSGRAIDALHRLGDVYVSTAHGEGFALGAFDAATLGRPVLTTAWGGPLDYLAIDDVPPSRAGASAPSRGHARAPSRSASSGVGPSSATAGAPPWPGAMPFRLASVPVFPPEAPSYWRSQRWAEVSVDTAAAMMRSCIDDPARHRDAAERIAERIATSFGEPVVTPRFVEALGLGPATAGRAAADA